MQELVKISKLSQISKASSTGICIRLHAGRRRERARAFYFAPPERESESYLDASEAQCGGCRVNLDFLNIR